MKKDDIRFVLTCSACQEQYDVYDKDGNSIAHLRLRHGSFHIDYPVGGETVCMKIFDDVWKGIFIENERDIYLKIAKEKICKYYNTQEE